MSENPSAGENAQVEKQAAPQPTAPPAAPEQQAAPQAVLHSRPPAATQPPRPRRMLNQPAGAAARQHLNQLRHSDFVLSAGEILQKKGRRVRCPYLFKPSDVP